MLAGTVMLGDLDDFIAPAQACVNPLFADAVNAKPVADADGAPSAPSPNRGLARVAIASDFLATSRCVGPHGSAGRRLSCRTRIGGVRSRFPPALAIAPSPAP